MNYTKQPIKIQKKIVKSIIQLTANKLNILLKTLSGHNNLNNHLHKILYSTTEACEYCNEPSDTFLKNSKTPETAYHILTECPAFAKTRAKVYNGEYYLSKAQIFGNMTITKATDRITKFFTLTKVFERPPKLNKRDLSPSRTWSKRKIDENSNNVNKKRRISHE